jgi:hypothetical protein
MYRLGLCELIQHSPNQCFSYKESVVKVDDPYIRIFLI